jgi:peptide/histidine transporter 3/4
MWFHIEPAGANPYKLVYKVFKFAYQHKVPLRRSAFTYCEDEYPSRMDLGKYKYGGPFTTKQVEDVKAFLGILKVLICIAPAFMLQTVIQSTLPEFAKHSNLYKETVLLHNKSKWHYFHIEGMARHIFISNGLLSPLLVVICIPLYMYFIRQRISYHIPGMLKRIGLGIMLLIMSLSLSLAMDVVVHARKTSDARCMFSGLTHDENIIHHNSTLTTSLPLFQNIYFFTLQHFLTAVANMLMDIAVLEFICSQSPYSMKGLILGFFFSIKASIQAIVIASFFPFGFAWHIKSLSCGSGFYLMNIVIGALELAIFTVVAKRYKYRTIDEPSNEYRYAEEYYSNIQ